MTYGQGLRRGKVLAATLVWVVVLAPLCYGLQAEKIDLKLRLQQGKTYRQTLDTTVETWQGPAGREQTGRMQIGMGLSYRVETVSPGTGRMDVRMTYEWVTMRVNSSDATIDFDSRTTKGELHPAARMFGAFVGQAVGVTLNPNGTVPEVRGVEQLQKSFLDKIAPSAGPERQALEAATAQQFGSDAIRAMMHFSFIPDRPVAIGESWRSKMPSPPGMQVDAENVYTLRQRNAGAATIGVTADFSMQLGAPGGINLSLTGSQVGQLAIDEATGWTTAAQFVQEASGSSGGVPMRMKTTVKLSGR